MIPVKVKKLDSKAKLPTRGSEFAAGADLYACVDGGTEIPRTAPFSLQVGDKSPRAMRGWFSQGAGWRQRGLRPPTRWESWTRTIAGK
ncbi:MAG: hypothetical protein ACLTSK_04180 [Christensenellales bacterium]